MPLTFPVSIFAGEPTYVPSDPDVAAYFTAAEGAGATYTDTTKEALDTFVLGMKSASLWALVRRWNPMLADGGDVLAGVAVVLNDTVGTPDVDTLNNYVAGDWDPAGGLQGNASTTYLNTGWTPSQAQMETGFVGMCYRGLALSSGENIFGTQSATDILAIGTNGGAASRCYYGASNDANGGALDPAIWSVYRTTPSNVVGAKNGVNGTPNATLTNPLVMSQPLAFGARRTNAGGILLPLGVNQRVAGYIACNVLDDTQRSNLQTLWAAFNTAIGR